MLKWSELTKAQKEYVKQLRREGWQMADAIIQAACCA